jgi:pimeloyl-ACP methyl ester carboxylesterase
MVQDILGLWKHLNIEKSYILGISMGGMLSQIIAARHPEKVLGLILISTAAAENQLNNLDAGPWGTDLKAIETRLINYVTPEFQERNKLLLQAMSKQIQNSVEKEKFDERAKEQRKALKNLDNTPILDKIKAKTMILHGQDDKIIPIKAAFNLSTAIPHSQLVTKQGIGHLLLAECSKDMTAHVKEFLEEAQKES